MFMGIRKSLWMYLGVYECFWIFECLWVFMGVYRCLRESMGVHEVSGICGFQWVFMGFWVAAGGYRCHWCRRVSMGVLPGVLNFRIEFFDYS